MALGPVVQKCKNSELGKMTKFCQQFGKLGNNDNFANFSNNLEAQSNEAKEGPLARWRIWQKLQYARCDLCE